MSGKKGEERKIKISFARTSDVTLGSPPDTVSVCSNGTLGRKLGLLWGKNKIFLFLFVCAISFETVGPYICETLTIQMGVKLWGLSIPWNIPGIIDNWFMHWNIFQVIPCPHLTSWAGVKVPPILYTPYTLSLTVIQTNRPTRSTVSTELYPHLGN